MNPQRSLENVRIARPCPARWEDMAGDEQVRFCKLCEKNVYNLSAMSREAATKLIQEKEGQLCASLYRRSDGTILTADCPVGVKAFASRVSRRVAAALAGLLLVLGGRFLTPELEERKKQEERRTGGVPSPGQRPQLSPEDIEKLRLLGSLSYADEPEPRAQGHNAETPAHEELTTPTPCPSKT